MIRVELELSLPTQNGDALGATGIISSALLAGLASAPGTSGLVVHAVRVEEMDA